MVYLPIVEAKYTVKSLLYEHQLSETTGFFEEDRQFRLHPLSSFAIKLPIFLISIYRKILEGPD